MRCTQCKTPSLEPQELEPGLIAAVCTTCSGTLLSLMNYRFWLDRHSAHSKEESLSNESIGEIAEVEGVHHCSKCSRLMLKYQMDPSSSHQLDLCATCDEAWLDKGEWQLLKHLDLQGKLPKIFTDAWQRNIRKQRQETALNNRFQESLGIEAFSKAHEFKQWLQQQPNCDEIRQFLLII